METITHAQIMQKLNEVTGELSIRKAAALVGVSAPFFNDVRRGYRYPGPTILSYLGYEVVKQEPRYIRRLYKPKEKVAK